MGTFNLREPFNGLPPSTIPPLERESFIGIVEFTVSEVITLSIEKGNCENYLLRIIT
jgi:hypothetical protein